MGQVWVAIADMLWGDVSSMSINTTIRSLEHSKTDLEQQIQDSWFTYQYILAK